jgi:hypothetical protein
MASPAITTLVKMVESLPGPMQKKAVEKMREYLEALENEQRWDGTFAKTQDKLVAAARRAKEQIKAKQSKHFTAR